MIKDMPYDHRSCRLTQNIPYNHSVQAGSGCPHSDRLFS